jgi:hypothetical protein
MSEQRYDNKDNSTKASNVLPANADAERAVLGSILTNESSLKEAAEILTPNDFSCPEHRAIFRVFCSMRKSGVPIDLVTIYDEASRDGGIEALGGVAYLSALGDGMPRVANVGHWASIVREAAIRRRAAFAAEAFAKAAVDLEDIEDLKARAKALVAEIDASPSERAKIVTAPELLGMEIAPREFLLDGLLTGKSMGEVFAWRGVGKTWAALSLGHAIATGGQFLKWKASRQRSVLFVDGELDGASLQQRIRALDASAGCEAHQFRLLCADLQQDPFPNLATRRAQALIENALGDSQLLILDNLAALAPSSNETEAEDWIAIQSWLLELRRQGIASLFLHHAGHAGWARGTTRREDLLDLVVELRNPKDYVASEGLRFEIHFNKTRGMLGAGAEPVEARLGTDLDGRLVWTWRDLEDVRARQVCELKRAGHSFRDIEEITGIPRSTAERLWRKESIA